MRCYHCGGGLRNWESGDDPWFEHAKWYPDCPHIILVKGQTFIHKVKGDIEQDCPKVSEEVYSFLFLLHVILSKNILIVKTYAKYTYQTLLVLRQ